MHAGMKIFDYSKFKEIARRSRPGGDGGVYGQV